MALFDLFSSPEEKQLDNNPQTMQVLASVLNGGGEGMNYTPNIPQEAPQEAPQQPQQVAPVQSQASQEQAPQEASQEGNFLTGLMDGFAKVMTDPDVLTGLNSFSAAMRGDVNSFNQYQNAYAERLEGRAKQRQAEQQRKSELAQARADRERERLVTDYTLDSVSEFERTGDPSVLQPNLRFQMEIDKAQRDADFQQWQMNNTENKQAQDQSNFETTRSDAKEESLQKRLDARREKQVEAAKVANANNGTVPAYRQNGTSYQVSKVDSKGNITWETLTKPEEEAQARRYLGTTEVPPLVESARQGTDFVNSKAGQEAANSMTVTGWAPTLVSSAPNFLKNAGNTFLNWASDEDARKLRAADAALEAQLLAAGVKAYVDAGNAKPNSNEEQAIARRLAPTIDYTSPETYKRTRAQAVDYVEKSNKSMGIPGRGQSSGVAPIGFGN